jgi:hypothetical protein
MKQWLYLSVAKTAKKVAVSLGFTSIAKSLEDKVKLPAGYQFSVLYA